MPENDKNGRAAENIEPRVMAPPGYPDTRHPEKPCNWRSTLSSYSLISSVLGAISVAFIPLVLGQQVGTSNIGGSSFTFGEIAILFFGVSAALLFGAQEFFAIAQAFDAYTVPKEYHDKFQHAFSDEQYVSAQEKSFVHNYNLARALYNTSIFLVFLGLLFALWPYNSWIGIIVFMVAAVVEAIQVIRMYGYTKPSPTNEQGTPS